MKQKKILIASRWFPPVQNPRAFRTMELVDEFYRRGYEIDLFLPEHADVKNNMCRRYFAVSTLESDAYRVQSPVVIRHLTIDRLLEWVKAVLFYIFGDSPKNVIYAWNLFRQLMKYAAKDYDAILSISYPFYVHVALAFFSRTVHHSCVKIADCGDPFYNNPSRKAPIYLKWLERYILGKFDYIVIPIQSAMAAYQHCDIDNRIRIIPQGVQLMDIDPTCYKPNVVPTFCYAGVFYETIRDPAYFFNYLCTLKQDFRFVVYALPNPFTAQFLQRYINILGERLKICKPISRKSLINVMSHMDFVVNFDNENSTQRPSKLIDYAMSRRPILSCNRHSFDENILRDFLRGDYQAGVNIDLAQYDIKNVVNKFESFM